MDGDMIWENIGFLFMEKRVSEQVMFILSILGLSQKMLRMQGFVQEKEEVKE